jgi:mRNA-degrading endonuclease toxin of MazEF toxin-antitoxin module
MTAKVRPCLLLTAYPEDDELALVTILPNTTALRGNRCELSIPKPFLQPGAFQLQQIQSVPLVRLIRRLGELNAHRKWRVFARSYRNAWASDRNVLQTRHLGVKVLASLSVMVSITRASMWSLRRLVSWKPFQQPLRCCSLHPRQPCADHIGEIRSFVGSFRTLVDEGEFLQLGERQ